MDANNQEKKQQTFFERVRAAVVTSLRRSSPGTPKKPDIVPKCPSRVSTPSTSRPSTPASAVKEDSKKKTIRSYLKVKKRERSLENLESGSEECVQTENRSRSVLPEEVVVILSSNNSEAAESDDYSSARSTASKQSVKIPGKARKPRLKEQGCNNPAGSQRSIHANTAATSSHMSQTGQIHRTTKSSRMGATLHIFVSKAYDLDDDLPLEINLSGVNAPKDLTRPATANINQLPASASTRCATKPRTPTRATANINQLPASALTQCASKPCSPTRATANINQLPASASTRCATTPRSSTKEVMKNTANKCQNPTRINNTRAQARASPQLQTGPQTAHPTRTDNPTQSSVTPDYKNIFHKTSPDTSSKYETTQSHSSTRMNTSQPKSADKSHAMLPQHQHSNNKDNFNKNRPMITAPNKYGSGGQKTVVSSKYQSQLSPKTWQVNSNSPSQGSSQTKPNHAFLPTDSGGRSMDRFRDNALYKNNPLVRPKTSLASNNSRSKLRPESKTNIARSPMNMESSVRPKTASAKFRSSYGSDTIKRPSTKNLHADMSHVDEPMRTEDRTEILFSNTMSSSSGRLNNTSTDLFLTYQLTGCRQATGRPSPTLRQTASYPLSKVELRDKLDTKASNRKSLLPLPPSRQNTFLIEASGQQKKSKWPLRRENTFLIEASEKHSKLTVMHENKINMATSSAPLFTTKEMKFPRKFGSELLRKTSNYFPLVKDSTYLIMPGPNVSADTLDDKITIPLLKKKSTYAVLHDPQTYTANSGIEMSLKRSGTYEVISKKSNSVTNINKSDT